MVSETLHTLCKCVASLWVQEGHQNASQHVPRQKQSVSCPLEIACAPSITQLASHPAPCRALLRLPPFPLARLRAAFADPPGFVEPPTADAGASASPDPEPETTVAKRPGGAPPPGEAPIANGVAHPETAPSSSRLGPGAAHAAPSGAAADPSSGDSLGGGGGTGGGGGGDASATGAAATVSGRRAEPGGNALAGGPDVSAAGDPRGPAAAAAAGHEDSEASAYGAAARQGDPAFVLDERGDPAAAARLQAAHAAALEVTVGGGPGHAEPALKAEAHSSPAGEQAHAAAVDMRPEDVATGGFALGAEGQSVLLRDVHAALLRLLEGLDDNVEEAPTLAGYGAAADLAPQDVYRCRAAS